MKKKGKYNNKIPFLKSLIGYKGRDCVRWPFSCNKEGRAMIWDGRKMTPAPRIMCVMANGPPPTKKHEAAHKCGKGHLACVAPNHLQWKTHKQNCDDTLHHGTRMFGAAVPLSKLNSRQALAVYNSKLSRQALATKYGVTVPTIRAIKIGHTWGWLTGADYHD